MDNDQNVECALLGALLLDFESKSCQEAMKTVQITDFVGGINRTIFAVIRAEFEKRTPIDIVTVADRLSKADILEAIGGEAYLLDLVEEVPSAANASYYAKLVAENAKIRNEKSAAGR